MRMAGHGIADGAELIVFPEYCTTGTPYPSVEVVHASAETIPGDGPMYRAYADLASAHGVWVAGWLVERDGNRYYNTSFLLDEAGRFRGKYGQL